MQDEREKIPSDVKRELRIEAGFGCCKCGFPFIEYHHIIPYSKVREHRKENMMVICSCCHDVVTSGAISEEEQRLWKTTPYNLNNKSIFGEIFLRRNTISVGGSSFRNNGPLVVIDSEPIISTYHDQYGNLLLSLSLYDENNTLLARLIHNEWCVRPDATWDLEARPKSILIRQAKRKICLKIMLVDNNVYLTGTFWKNGHLIKANSKAINIGSNDSAFGICEFCNCYVVVDTNKQTISVRLGRGLHPNQPY